MKTAGIVRKISIENFLCHDKLEIDFNEQINFIIGMLFFPLISDSHPAFFPHCCAIVNHYHHYYKLFQEKMEVGKVLSLLEL